MSGNYTVPGAAPAGAAPASGYYSRPDLWTDAQKHQDDVEASYLRLKHLEGGLQTQTKNIEGMTNSLRFLQRRFQLAEKAGDTAQMESIKLHYDEVYSQLRRADLAYAKSYRDYKQAYSGYETAWNAQNTYMTAQEEAEKQWRSTIRDSATVGAELQQVQEQLRKLTQQDSTGRILTGLGNWAQNVLASSSGFAVPGQEYTPQNAKQIAELEAREKLLKEEYQWGLQFEDEALRNSEEFKSLSQQGLEKWQQMRAQQAQLKGKSALEHNAAAYAAANENPFVTAFNQVVQQYREDDSYQQPNEKWSQEQLDRFGYLLMTETAKAWEYAEQVNNQISQEKAQEQKDAIAQKATASGWAGVGHTIGALATAPLALADVMDNLAEFAGRGTVTSKDSVTPYDYSQAVVGGISKKLNEAGTIDESVPVIGGKGWGDLYSIGFSVAQSLIAGKVTKVAGTGALTLLQFMGQGAAAGVDSGLESGASGTRAMAYGLISGAAEGFAEQIGVDNLMKLVSARTFKGFVKNLLKQSAAEGIEETVTAVLDSAADRIILGENSTFRKAVAEYERSMSHEDAVRLAWTETIGGIVFDGLSGAISGGLGAGVTTTGANVVESIRDHRQAKPAATEAAPQGAAEVPAAAAPTTFQEEVQRQVAENMAPAKSAEGTVDTGRGLGYDNTVNEAKGGDISNEGREETREAFHRRAHEKVYTVRERGKIACGYHPAANKTERAGRTEKALQELGIQVIVHDGLEINADGKTRLIQGDATSVGGDAIYVRNSMETDPMETTGHEAYHFWKHTDARTAYEEIVAGNIDFASDAFMDFLKKVEDAYFEEEVGIDDDGADKLVEEIFAYITGLIHSGNGESIVRPFLRDYAAVKAAWDTLAHSQASTAAPTTFQEEVQRQVAENMGAGKAAQGATAQLAAPTVQVSQDVWQQGQRLAQITGRNIKFYEGKASEKGFFDPKTGEIWVNAKGVDPLAQVFSHELTHSIEQAGVYGKLSSFVLNRMQDTGMDLDTAREAKRQQYQRQGRPLPTQAAVDQELVAEYVSKYLLTNEQQIVSLVQQDRSLGQKIHDFFDRLLAKLGNKNAQERAFLSRAKNIYAKALRQTQNVGTAQTVGQTATAATEGADAEGISLDDLDAQLAAGEITEAEYDEIRDEHELLQEEQYSAGERKYSVGEQTIEDMVVADGMENSSYEGISLSSDPRIYSYEFLTAQPDMEVVQLPEMSYIRDASGKLNTSKVVAEGIKNALSVGVERDGKIYISNKYTGRQIRVDVSAIRHGLNGKANRLITNARLGSKIGEVVQNAIPINALHNTSPDADGTYAMAAYATDDSGREIVAIVTVEQRSGNITGLDTFDVTHAVSGRQKRSEQADTKSQGVYPIKLTSTITIADLLSKVNSTYRSILSEDVLQAIGESRPVGGHYSERVKFSLADEAENVSEEKPEEDAPEAKPDLRSSMPRKAAEMLKRTERELLWAIADRLSVPKLAGREYLTPIIQEMADEYLEKGSISPETRQLLFEKAYSQAVIVDAEFYEQYKHIKDHLRTTPVTISDRDKLDIADFNDFRKRAFGSLKIVNEGGLPVDVAYQELQSMAPELFPESITHPADQLVRMFDASRSIQVTEKTVQDYFGKYEPEYRKGAQSAFEEALAEAAGKLWEVKRFAEEKIAKEKEPAPATEQEVMEAYLKLKKAKRDYEKVSAKNLLTESDQMQVGRLLRHEILPEHLKEGKDNVKGILAVFQAKQEYERLCKLVAEYKRHLRGKARAEADELLKTANSWKDKKVGIAYSRETMERNVMDIIENKALAQQVIDKYFTPVHTAEAASTRFKREYRDRVRSMNISLKVQKGNLVSEEYAVQLLGEAQDNIRMLENARGRIKQRDGKNRHEWQAVIDALWAENPLLDRGKIENAVKVFRKIYDELLQQMNQVRVANGYEPVNYRQGYFPHFQAGDSDSILAQFGRALGIDTRIDMLPTTINGMTHAFKPGIQWFGNAQERLGFETAYGAVEGFDKYIEGVANVIFHTRNIQNLRAFASQIRYRTSDEGIRKQVDEIYERQGLTDEEKQQLITEIYAHGKFTLSGFVAELDEYTNLLAGKKSRYDRAIEAAMGRKAYSVLKAWESRVAANMIAGNLTSALTNFIPWTQAGAQVGYIRLLRGVEQTLRATRSDDGFAGGSTFLTNRRGVDPLVQTWAQKASGIASKPMELIDSLVSESIVRAAYEQNRQQGLSEAEAMAQADAFAAGVMADRSKGATPTLFHSTNPLMKAFTQFQLEVNNQFSEVFKDIPRRYRDKKLRELVWVLLKYFLGAWVYNWLYEKLIGRRPALDPIGMLCQFGEDWKEDGLGTAGANLASDALGQLPFASGLTLIGVETDGGRLPASSAVMDLTAIWKAATTEGWSAKKRWKEVQDELNKLAYVVPPFGGNQVGKLYKGLKAYFQGGSYSVDAAGNEVLQYPVYKDNPGDAFASFVKATVLGKSALGTAQEWVDKGFNSLGAKQTAAYQDMLEAGVSDREAYELIRQISDAKETDTMKKAAVQRDVLRKSQVSGDGKAIAYYGLMASEKEWAIMDRLDDMGADAGAVTDALMVMADVRAKDGSRQADVLAVISKAVLTDEEKAVLVGSVIGTEMLTEEGNLTQYAKFDYAVQNGMGVDQYIQYRASGASIDDYLELRDAGATVEDAMEAAMALQELKDSVEDPTTVQKWKAVMAGVTDPERQMISLSVVMTDSQYAKLTTARGFGVSPADFVSANEKIAKYDRDGNGRLTQAEVTQGISNLRLTTQQKAVLWQLITGSSSAKNNPYSQAIGERVIAALEKAKAEGKKPGHSFQDEIMRQIMANMNP